MLEETNQPAKCTGQGRHTKEVRGPELYPTPPEVTLALCEAEPLPKVLWEPAAGMGHMALPLKDRGHEVLCTDLHDYGKTVHKDIYIYPGVDFIDHHMPWTVGCVITNPPFSIAAEFVRAGLKVAPKVCVLGRLAFLEGQRRKDIIEGNLARVYVFENRLPMMHRWAPDPDTGEYVEWPGKKAASAMAFAWFVFEQDHDPSRGTTLRRIRWYPVA